MVDEHVARVLYHRVATAWGSGQTLHITDCAGGEVELTNIFEQTIMLAMLKGIDNGKMAK